MGFATIAIHTGSEPDEATGSVTVPIYQTSTYAQDALGKHKGYEYARTQNPTRSALERNIAALEGARFGFAFASGMAAIEPNTKMVFIETPTNPVMIVTDLKEVSEIAHRTGARVVCDNTFMSPYLQRPLEFGVDIVVHSTTKYLNGHSDGVGGIVVLNDEKDAEWIGFVQNSVGAILSPFDSWLVMRGTKTLALRMEQHDKSGRAVAAFLEEHPKVKKIYYPGSASHPQHALARRQQHGFGGMVAFDVGSLAAARTVLESVKLCTLAESLGGVETLISHPATMTHASVDAAKRGRLGITDGLVRISVGIEDTDDIIADLDQALDKI